MDNRQNLTSNRDAFNAAESNVQKAHSGVTGMQDNFNTLVAEFVHTGKGRRRLIKAMKERAQVIRESVTSGMQQANFIQVEPVEPSEPGITKSTGGPYVWYDTGGTIVAESPQLTQVGKPRLKLRLESRLGWARMLFGRLIRRQIK